ncbi:nuclear RNA export factor 2-like isoform X1 [Sorex araneus]|uniref:nuclear RNA export factor 2-like isoform X1 n=2 Tax=Sorex araneus TaxID=42254 RepID=UPI00243344BF|nr:nuclear RNA export factor 2-like isoform X1 [Sorex araneus]
MELSGISETEEHRKAFKSTPRFVLQNMSERKKGKFVLPYNNYWTGGDEEYDDDYSSSQRRKGLSSFQDNYWKKNLGQYYHDEYESNPSQLKENRKKKRKNSHRNFRVRYKPYTVRNKRRVRWQCEGNISVTVWADKKSPEIGTGDNSQNESLGKWFKITIPYGRKYDKMWLITTIQSHCSVSFTPVDFHYVKSRARFFTQDPRVACALRDVSCKILDEENRKICIFVSQSFEPFSVRNKLKPEEMEQLELTMIKRYDDSQKSLDLQKLRYDPDLVNHAIDIVLNRRNCMFAVLQIIERSFPELLSLNLRNNKLHQLDGLSDITQKVTTIKILDLSKNELKSMWELSKIKTLNLEELCLKGNPLCETFPDSSSYISAIQDYFPTLLCLDGLKLCQPVNDNVSLPMNLCKEKKDSHSLKNMIMHFLKQYYWIYDCGDRRGLLDAYHDDACFSLSIPFNDEDPSSSHLCEYLKDNKNMKILKDPDLRAQLLKHTKHDIVRFLCVLPQTQHDIDSIMIDMWMQSGTMICFSVHGVFREVDKNYQDSLCTFTRTFITVPARNPSLCIMNDEFFVRISTPSLLKSAFSIRLYTLSSSSVPILSKDQKDMIRTFSIHSGMNVQSSHKCLEDNNWNYRIAFQNFIRMKNEGKIPEEAFQETP